MNDYSKLLDYFKESFGLIDYFHFNSETTQNVYSGNLHIENGKIIPITHSEIKDNRHKKSFDASILRIGFIGNDTPYKGLPLLLQVLKRITDKSSWRLDVWGGKVAQEKDWQIFYRGKFDSRSLATVYDGMDVLIVPSIWKETFGFVVLEALSYGVPVIVSDNVGAKDIVKQYDERFVFTSASELLALLNQIFKDRSLLVEFNEKVLNGVWKHSMKDHTEEILRLYEAMKKGGICMGKSCANSFTQFIPYFIHLQKEIKSNDNIHNYCNIPLHLIHPLLRIKKP